MLFIADYYVLIISANANIDSLVLLETIIIVITFRKWAYYVTRKNIKEWLKNWIISKVNSFYKVGKQAHSLLMDW